jgi:hypothetical protein
MSGTWKFNDKVTHISFADILREPEVIKWCNIAKRIRGRDVK